MAKVKEATIETVETPEEVLKVTGEVVQDLPAVPEPQQPLPVVPGTSNLMKNLLIGAGIILGGGLAVYGLFTLIKKGVKLIKEKNDEKTEGNGIEHPDYEYKKIEEPESKDEDPKAKTKNPIGFRYDK